MHPQPLHRRRAALQVLLAGVLLGVVAWLAMPHLNFAKWVLASAAVLTLLGMLMLLWALWGHTPSQEQLVDSAYVRRFYETERGVSRRLKRPAASGKALATAPPFIPTAWSATLLRRLDWQRFEAVVQAFYEQVGFKTQAKPHGVDGGVDIWLFSPKQPDRPLGVVQCRHWRDRPIGIEKMRALASVMQEESLKRAQYVTTAEFSNEAIAYAREHGIHLIGETQLLEMIGRRTPAQQRALLELATQGQWWRPTCGACGAKMVERGGSRGEIPFWGCETFPHCRHTMPRRRPETAS